MTNAIKMRAMTNDYETKQALKRMDKRHKWMNKVIAKATKRAKRGYSWIEVKMPSYVSPSVATDEFAEAGYNVTKGTTHYRLTW
jgi:hypothetical protein